MLYKGGIIKRFHIYVLAIVLFAIFSFLFLCGKNSYASEIALEQGASQIVIDNIGYEKIVAYAPVGLFSQKEMLDSLNLAVYPEDKIKFFPDPALGIGSVIEIVRANQVVVNDAGKIKAYRTWDNNIDQFLQNNNIHLAQDDKINVDLSEAIHNNLEITISRVNLSELVEYEDIDYEIIYQDDSELERGKTKVIQNPEYGEKALTYQIKEENGKQILKQLVSEEIVKEPVNKIIAEGTKVTYLGSGKATWYDLIGGMTAASNILPYGTNVIVRNNSNGKSVEVTIVDHGILGNAVIDLSDEAFSQLAPLGAGTISVTLEKP